MKSFFLLLFISVIFCGCQKELDSSNNGNGNAAFPTVTTAIITSITTTGALGGGNITNDGGAAIIARGVCWGTAPGTVITGNHTTDGTGTGSFTSNIAGLSPVTVYYARAYATNSTGTAYGAEISFTTISGIGFATVTTSAVTSITSTTAIGGGNITTDGGATVTARGVCWSTSPDPVVTGSHTTDGTGTGAFTSNITLLSSLTTYYLRAYATNIMGTAYGAQITLTTQTAQVIDSARFIFMGGAVNFYCFNGSDGSLKWLKTFTANIYGAACYANGYVYTTCEDGKLYAFDTLGNLKWSVTITTNLPIGYRFNASVLNGLVYMNNDRYVFAYDAITGALVWQFDAFSISNFNYIHTSLTVDKNTIYAGATYTFAIDALSGNLKWQLGAGISFFKPRVYNNKLYTLNESLSNQEIRVLDASTGLLVWNKVLGYSPNNAIALNVAEGNIYLFKDGVTVYDTINGTKKWSVAAGNNTYSFQGGSSPIVKNGLLHVVSDYNNSGKAYVYNAQTGASISEYGGNIHESDVTVVDEFSYYGSRDIFNSYNGYLYAVKLLPDGTISPTGGWRSTVKSDFRTTPCVVTMSGKMYRAADSQ